MRTACREKPYRDADHERTSVFAAPVTPAALRVARGAKSYERGSIRQPADGRWLPGRRQLFFRYHVSSDGPAPGDSG